MVSPTTLPVLTPLLQGANGTGDFRNLRCKRAKAWWIVPGFLWIESYSLFDMDYTLSLFYTQWICHTPWDIYIYPSEDLLFQKEHLLFKNKMMVEHKGGCTGSNFIYENYVPNHQPAINTGSPVTRPSSHPFRRLTAEDFWQSLPQPWCYCGWKKSCTLDGWNPVVRG